MKRNQSLGLAATFLLLGGAVLGCSAKASSSPVADAAVALVTEAGVDAGVEAGDEAGDEVDAGPTPQCGEYCDAIMANCSGALGTAGSNAQYGSKEGCLNQCQQINSGDYTDRDGADSLGCRLTHAKSASSGAAAHCASAGASGGGVCNDVTMDAGADSRCMSFCNQTLALCTKDNGVDPQPYLDSDTCMRACGTSFKFDSAQAELTQTGNTLNCRQYHLIMAYDASDGGTAVYHCPHLAFPASAFCR